MELTLKGQFPYTLTPAQYVYPREQGNWSSELDDDSDTLMKELGLTKNQDECYTIVFTDKGIIYTYRKKYYIENRLNCALVGILAPGPTHNGGKLTELLKSAINYGIEINNPDVPSDEEIEEIINKHRGNELFFQEHNSFSLENGKAEFSYKDEEELFDILENPYQKEFKECKCIHLVKDLKEEVNFPTINNKKLNYFIKPPEDNSVTVKDGICFVREGEVFTLQFKKEGWKNEKIHVTYQGNCTEQENKYYTIDKERKTICVKSAEECGIEFKKPANSKEVHFFPVHPFKLKPSNVQETYTISCPNENAQLCKAFPKEMDFSEGKEEDIPLLFISTKRWLAVVCGIFLAVGILLGWGITYSVGAIEQDKSETTDTTTSVVAVDPPSTPTLVDDPKTEVAVKTPEQADEEYLSNHDVWYRDSLQSDKYKVLYKNLVMEGHTEKDKNVTAWKKRGKYDLSIIDSCTIENNDNWNTIKKAIQDGFNNSDWAQAKKFRDKLLQCTDSIKLQTIVQEDVVEKPSSQTPHHSENQNMNDDDTKDTRLSSDPDRRN